MIKRIMVKTIKGQMIKVDVAMYRAFVLAAREKSSGTYETALRVANYYGFDYRDALRLVMHVFGKDPLRMACGEGCAVVVAASPNNAAAGVGVAS